VTHDQEEALTLSDRIAVMSEGRDLQVDTPTRLYEHPVNREVASFIGTMNFFDSVVTSVKDDNAVIKVDGLGEVSAPMGAVPLLAGNTVSVAIRPEKFSLTDEKPDGAQYSAKGQLENAAYLGERSHYYVSIDGVSQPVAVSAQNRDRAKEGEGQNRPVWLSWDSAAIVVLKDV
jgi:ABC-type Fe3+/spermidine/putrescine transport system ATPase subunit